MSAENEKPRKRKANAVQPVAASVPVPKPETPKSRLLEIEQRPGVSMNRLETDIAAAGLASNAGLIVRFSHAEHGELSLTDMVKSLKEAGEAVNRNDMKDAEQLLTAQAIALNSIFCELARRSALNMGEYLDATERYMRLALKAQGQCRTTLETLAAMKNPPIVYAKQANIANGPQQVNNGGSSQTGSQGTHPQARAPAHARGERQIPQNKLLEDQRNGSTYMDPRTTAAATRGDTAMAAVDASDRTENAKGQGAV